MIIVLSHGIREIRVVPNSEINVVHQVALHLPACSRQVGPGQKDLAAATEGARSHRQTGNWMRNRECKAWNLPQLRPTTTTPPIINYIVQVISVQYSTADVEQDPRPRTAPKSRVQDPRVLLVDVQYKAQCIAHTHGISPISPPLGPTAAARPTAQFIRSFNRAISQQTSDGCARHARRSLVGRV